MRARWHGSKGGFTLVELMVVVLIVGVLAVLATYGVRKYLADAKSAEARNAVGMIAKDSVAALERPPTATTFALPGVVTGLQRQFCGSSTLVPAASKVSARKYQSQIADWGGSGTAGWTCLRFTMDEPQYYAYSYHAVSTDGWTGGFVASAYGDLNGDGIFSTFAVTGAATQGAVAISPNIQETNPEE